MEYMIIMKERDNVSKTIYKILKKNPDKWITSKELEQMTGFIRQSINWALRNLSENDKIHMKKAKIKGINKRVNIVKYKDD